MSITLPHPGESNLKPQDRRRIRRLGLVASELAEGRTDVVELKARLAEGLAVRPVANLVKASAQAISHANVSAARSLGLIVPGP